MAEDPKLPVLERVRFLAIFSQNLDDFFQVRVAGLKEQVLAAVAVSSPDGMSPLEQLRAIRTRVEAQVERQVRLFNTGIVPALAEAGIEIVRADQVSKKELSQLHSVFRQQIFPVLTPLAVDPGHPFPYISHLSLNLAVTVRDPQRRQQRFARVKVPPVLPRFIPLAEETRFMPLEDVIALHLQALFPGMDVIAHHPFRVTRDGDLDDVDSERRKDREDLLPENRVELAELFLAHLVGPHDGDTGVGESRDDASVVKAQLPLHEALDSPANCFQLLERRHPIWRGDRHRRQHLLLQAGDAHLEEVVQVLAENRQESHPFEQGQMGVFGHGQDALVEGQPGELSVQESTCVRSRQGTRQVRFRMRPNRHGATLAVATEFNR